jgi:hypothetical protein
VQKEQKESFCIFRVFFAPFASLKKEGLHKIKSNNVPLRLTVAIKRFKLFGSITSVRFRECRFPKTDETMSVSPQQHVPVSRRLIIVAITGLTRGGGHYSQPLIALGSPGNEEACSLLLPVIMVDNRGSLTEVIIPINLRFICLRFVCLVLIALAAFSFSAVAQSEDDKTLSPYFFVQGSDPSLDRLPLKDTRVNIDVEERISGRLSLKRQSRSLICLST